MKIRKAMGHIFTKLRSKKPFYQKLIKNPPVQDFDRLLKKKEMMKNRQFRKNTWYDCLIHNIPESIKNLWMLLGEKL